ncbi:MCHR1 [Branchiostoma lanceolatum]|uniref:MCHR1 protein n=1 Tax=Branchiostoma lanceolatum TaxID=7740 RepID=A0A8K0AEQ5_BRALA|nr:MCHR1 [Branchiostoma lanceolatum]
MAKGQEPEDGMRPRVCYMSKQKLVGRMETEIAVEETSWSLWNESEESNITFSRWRQEQDKSGFLGAVAVAMPIVFYAIFVVGILGNSVVMYVMIRHTKLRTPSDIFIFNLALADELFLIGIPFFAQQFISDEWTFGSAMCKIVYTLDSNNQFASVYILTTMSIDRYLAISHPFRSISFRTRKVAIITNIGVWVASLASISPVLAFARQITYPNGLRVCEISFPEAKDIYWFTIYQFILAFAIPVVIITFCYANVFRKLKQVVNPAASNAEKKTKKVAKMVLVVVIVFLVCWLPYYVIALVNMQMSSGPSYAFLVAYFVSICLGYANSCINPFIYLSFSAKFRKHAVDTLFCRDCRKQRILPAPIDDAILLRDLNLGRGAVYYSAGNDSVFGRDRPMVAFPSTFRTV